MKNNVVCHCKVVMFVIDYGVSPVDRCHWPDVNLSEARTHSETIISVGRLFRYYYGPVLCTFAKINFTMCLRGPLLVLKSRVDTWVEINILSFVY